MRPKHPSKDIEKVIQSAEQQGWRYRASSGYTWGLLYCPHQSRDGCKVPIWSTPSNPVEHSKQILSKIRNCPHGEQ